MQSLAFPATWLSQYAGLGGFFTCIPSASRMEGCPAKDLGGELSSWELTRARPLAVRAHRNEPGRAFPAKRQPRTGAFCRPAYCFRFNRRCFTGQRGTRLQRASMAASPVGSREMTAPVPVCSSLGIRRRDKAGRSRRAFSGDCDKLFAAKPTRKKEPSCPIHGVQTWKAAMLPLTGSTSC